MLVQTTGQQSIKKSNSKFLTLIVTVNLFLILIFILPIVIKTIAQLIKEDNVHTIDNDDIILVICNIIYNPESYVILCVILCSISLILFILSPKNEDKEEIKDDTKTEELEKEIKELKDKIIKHTDEMNSKTEELNKLQSQCKTLEQAIETKDNSPLIESYQQNIESYKNEIESYKEQIENLKKSLQKSEQLSKDENKKNTKQIEQLEDLNNKNIEQIKELEDKIRKLELENKEQVESHKNQLNEAELHANTIQQKKEEINQSKKTIEELNKEISGLRQEIKTKENEDKKKTKVNNEGLLKLPELYRKKDEIKKHINDINQSVNLYRSIILDLQMINKKTTIEVIKKQGQTKQEVKVRKLYTNDYIEDNKKDEQNSLAMQKYKIFTEYSNKLNKKNEEIEKIANAFGLLSQIKFISKSDTEKNSVHNEMLQKMSTLKNYITQVNNIFKMNINKYKGTDEKIKKQIKSEQIKKANDENIIKDINTSLDNNKNFYKDMSTYFSLINLIGDKNDIKNIQKLKKLCDIIVEASININEDNIEINKKDSVIKEDKFLEAVDPEANISHITLKINQNLFDDNYINNQDNYFNKLLLDELLEIQQLSLSEDKINQEIDTILKSVQKNHEAKLSSNDLFKRAINQSKGVVSNDNKYNNKSILNIICEFTFDYLHSKSEYIHNDHKNEKELIKKGIISEELIKAETLDEFMNSLEIRNELIDKNFKWFHNVDQNNQEKNTDKLMNNIDKVGIDNKPFTLFCAELKKGEQNEYIIGLSTEIFSKGSKKTDTGLIFSVNKDGITKVFLSKKDKESVTHDEYFLIFGNSEIRLRNNETEMYSNYAINNCNYYEPGNNNPNVLDLLMHEEYENTRARTLYGYEVYQMKFVSK